MLPEDLMEVDLGSLGFDRGAHLLVKRALARVPVGATIEIRGSDPHLGVHLRGWCRSAGHAFAEGAGDVYRVLRGAADRGRWNNAERSGGADSKVAGNVVEHPPAHWGLAARGALVEAGGPSFDFPIDRKVEVWADEARQLYLQAVAAQWNPDEAIDWTQTVELAEEVEDATVQLMTYLIENEMAALIVPARFLARIHPHFREVLQLLAIQAADEARHIEVFTRRALLHRSELGLSTTGGQTSLKTLIDEQDFALAAFLLSVMGEGTFLSLLRFLEVHAPDPITRRIMELAARDEARHVAFGMAHLRRHLAHDASERERLANAIHRRHESLRHTAGLNDAVFDALLLLAAGGFDHEQLAAGHAKVLALQGEMDLQRRHRLAVLGFSEPERERLSALHTRNFM